MNRDFVPYQEALALKELGFDEPTLYHWHNSEKNHPLTNEIYFTGCQPHTNSGIKDIGNENHIWSAPLYQQAFRWFREMYRLVISISPSEQNNLIEFKGIIYIYKSIRLGNTVDILHCKFYNSHEKAELECLRKLIEIVKEN
jgi:hypothetical protein